VAGVLLVAGLVAGSSALLWWGVLVLMLTPVLRALVLTLGLVRERDWTFALVSLLILGVLGSSAVTGLRFAAARRAAPPPAAVR
jgi:hypothetical protein